MAKITLKGNPVKTIGKLPKIGKKAPKFKLVKSDLTTARLKDFKGKKVIININPYLFCASKCARLEPGTKSCCIR